MWTTTFVHHFTLQHPEIMKINYNEFRRVAHTELDVMIPQYLHELKPEEVNFLLRHMVKSLTWTLHVTVVEPPPENFKEHPAIHHAIHDECSNALERWYARPEQPVNVLTRRYSFIDRLYKRVSSILETMDKAEHWMDD